MSRCPVQGSSRYSLSYVCACVDSCPFLCAVLSTTCQSTRLAPSHSRKGESNRTPAQLQLVRQHMHGLAIVTVYYCMRGGRVIHYMYLTILMAFAQYYIQVCVCVRTLPWYATEACQLVSCQSAAYKLVRIIHWYMVINSYLLPSCNFDGIRSICAFHK